MGFYQFKSTQKLQASIPEVWDFISTPVNLAKITPPHMNFVITSDQNRDKIYKGMIISYRVSPLKGLRTTWVTEITHLKENEYFVDEQRVGPYRMWHHQHFIKEDRNGTLMTDIVSYQPPFGIIGSFANQLLIKNQLNKIFNYRKEILEQLFNPTKG